jgi:signal transduction histidine kinase
VAGELTSKQHEYLSIVLRNVKSFRQMIDDLLEVTRVRGGHIVVEAQCTSVAEVIAFAMSTVQGAALAKGGGLSVELGGELPLARADPTRLRQVLIILRWSPIR